MQVTQTHRNPLTCNDDGGRSETIIPNNTCQITKERETDIDFKIVPIENYDGYYISNTGKVYCDLGRGNRNKNKRVEMYEVNPRLTKNGYARVYARNTSTNKRTDLYIHRLVAEYFIDNPLKKKYVNHKNCIRSDNRVENLEWCTAKENTSYTMEVNHIKRCQDTGRYVSNFAYEIPNK